jgi:hypothetical protein
VVGLVAGVLLVGACSGQGSGEDANAAAAAVEFSRSLGAAPQTACGLLAPKTLEELEATDGACAGALPGALPEEVEASTGAPRSTEVYGKAAIVHLSTDTIFLARFRDGWRVTAAGCTAREAGRPYDCKVKGA